MKPIINNGIAMGDFLDLNRYCNRRSPFFEGTEAAGCEKYDHVNGVFLPVSYGNSLKEEHDAVRERVALYDTTLQTQIMVKGPDAVKFSDFILTRNVEGIGVGQARYGFVCRPDGVIITDAVITRVAEDEVWVSPTIGDMILWAQAVAHFGNYDVEIREADYISTHLHGARSGDLLRKHVGDSIDDLGYFRMMSATIEGVKVYIARTAASPVLGYEVFAPRSDEPAMKVWNAIVSAGEEYNLVVRGYDDPSDAIESGMLFFSYWTTFEDSLTPLEFWRNFVDMDAGDFVGKSAFKQTIENGGPARKMIGLVGTDQDLRMQGERWEIKDGDQVVGYTRWITYSETLGKNIGYGLVESKYADQVGAELTLVHPNGTEPMTISEVPIVKPRRDS